MLNSVRQGVSSWPQTALRLLFVFLLVSVTGCGVIGGGEDDGEDKKYPEPPGRPNTAAVEMQSAPGIWNDAA